MHTLSHQLNTVYSHCKYHHLKLRLSYFIFENTKDKIIYLSIRLSISALVSLFCRKYSKWKRKCSASLVLLVKITHGALVRILNDDILGKLL